MGQCVPIEKSSYIPIPPEILQEKLGQHAARAKWTLKEALKELLEPSSDAGSAGPQRPASGKGPEEELWDAFCEQLKIIVNAELTQARESLITAYQPFDPARRRWVGKWHLPNEEATFARELLRAAKLAGFSPVSRIDLERTRELKADLLSLPVTILWDRLDSRWIETSLKQSSSADQEGQQYFDPELSDFGAYALVLKRGVAVERHEGHLLWQKLESIQSQWLIKTGKLLRLALQRSVAFSWAAWTNVLVPAGRSVTAAVHELLPAVESRLASSQKLMYARRTCSSVWTAARSCGERLLEAAQRRTARAWPSVRERFRGLRMRLAGTQVLRQLQPGRYQYTYWLFENVLSKGRWSKERRALIGRLADAWEQEAALRGRRTRRGDLPEEEAESERREARARGDFVERISIEHVPLSLSTLFRPVLLQEPQFQEILVAYRLQEPPDVGSEGLMPWDVQYRPLPQRPIFVRRFYEVPMKDIRLVLPEQAWRVRGRPLDMIRLDLVTLSGVLGVVAKYFGAPHGYLVLLPLLWLPIRTFLSYRRTRVYFKSVTSSMLFDRCLDKDAALMRLLPDAAEAQVFAECALAFWALLDLENKSRAAGSSEPVAVEEVRVARHAAAAVKTLLSAADLPKAGFHPDLHSALRRLETWQLVTSEPGDVEDDGDRPAEEHGKKPSSQHEGKDRGHSRRHLRWSPVSLAEAPKRLRALRAEWLRMEL